jgi:hypothetical protein
MIPTNQHINAISPIPAAMSQTMPSRLTMTPGVTPATPLRQSRHHCVKLLPLVPLASTQLVLPSQISSAVASSRPGFGPSVAVILLLHSATCNKLAVLHPLALASTPPSAAQVSCRNALLPHLQLAKLRHSHLKVAMLLLMPSLVLICASCQPHAPTLCLIVPTLLVLRSTCVWHSRLDSRTRNSMRTSGLLLCQHRASLDDAMAGLFRANSLRATGLVASSTTVAATASTLLMLGLATSCSMSSTAFNHQMLNKAAQGHH